MKFKVSRKHLSVLGAIAGGVLTLSIYQNCSNATFSLAPTDKDSTLTSQSVFPSGGVDGGVPVATPTPNSGGNDGGNSNTGNNGGGNDGGTAGNTHGGNDGGMPGGCGGGSSTLGGNDAGLTFVCSSRQSIAAGTATGASISNVVSSSSLKLEVVTASKTPSWVCEITGNFLSEVTTSHSITLTSCPALQDSTDYVAYVVNGSANINSSASTAQGAALATIPFAVSSSGALQIMGSQKVNIVYDLNSQTTSYNYASLNSSGASTPATQANCQQLASPLIVSFNEASNQGIQLSSQAEGIQFNILGEKSYPLPNTKKQISWFLSASASQYYFIVLPNAQGQVLGVDQMFGNDTQGPDGQYAENGYDALAKYDANKDGQITSADPIYSQLRLWSDANQDGIAQPEELHTLSEMQISAIDLAYSAKYKEVDQYGNQTLYKSVVRTSDGQLHLLFDLWFHYFDVSQPTLGGGS